MIDYTIRLILLGNSFVGKSFYANKLTRNYFITSYEPTVGVDFFTKTVLIDGKFIKCQIWDTAGQLKFAPLLLTYYKNIGGAILIYDVSNKKSFENLDFWLKQLKENAPDNYPFSKLLIGNITTNKRQIKKKDAEDFCIKNKLLYTEINIKKDKNLEESLFLILNEIYKNKDKNKGIRKNEILKYTKEKEEKQEKEKTCCCWGF